jgi:hypothetical protein
MSGSSRNGFTWKQVADILHISESSNAEIFRREIEHQTKGRIGARRSPVVTHDPLRTSERAQLRRPALDKVRLVRNASTEVAVKKSVL